MFLLDKLITAPFYGILKIAETVHEAVQQEQALSAENIKNELSELYRSLEMGQISEHDFDKQEKLLLDKLEKLE